jgi:hypothetical protein
VALAKTRLNHTERTPLQVKKADFAHLLNRFNAAQHLSAIAPTEDPIPVRLNNLILRK